MSQTLLVNKSDFADVAIVKGEEAALAEGAIRLSLGPCALTANNVSYMVTGERIGYWNYFDPAAYGIALEGFGRMPVWGYARVEQSRCEAIKVGQEIYGFFPITERFDMHPIKISTHGFMDGAPHRLALHDIYNHYSFTQANPSYAVEKNLQPLLRPLFTTSFLIDDFLAEENYFGAEQVLILSASSKTALGTAFCLSARGDIKNAGLTSEANMAFTQSTGLYNEVQSYEALTDLNPDVKTVIVDMSGNAKVTARLQDHFEENLKYICRVGATHWTAGKAQPSAQKTPTTFFFAPNHAQRRLDDWGTQGFAQKLGARWIPFLKSAAQWLKVETYNGAAPMLKAYKEVLSGTAAPDIGYLFKL